MPTPGLSHHQTSSLRSRLMYTAAHQTCPTSSLPLAVWSPPCSQWILQSWSDHACLCAESPAAPYLTESKSQAPKVAQRAPCTVSLAVSSAWSVLPSDTCIDCSLTFFRSLPKCHLGLFSKRALMYTHTYMHTHKHAHMCAHTCMHTVHPLPCFISLHGPHPRLTYYVFLHFFPCCPSPSAGTEVPRRQMFLSLLPTTVSSAQYTRSHN